MYIRKLAFINAWLRRQPGPAMKVIGRENKTTEGYGGQMLKKEIQEICLHDTIVLVTLDFLNKISLPLTNISRS
jgi:hypothetical protein